MVGAGLSLPSSVGNTGGFEFPTFPEQAVRIGAQWDENGNVLSGFDNNRNNTGQWVYKLSRIYSGKQGRIAVIHYKKTTDFSNWGLGGSNAFSSLGQGMNGMAGLSGIQGAAAMIGGLVIELEGEIEFNVDHGLVTKSTQSGTWSLNMDVDQFQGQRNQKPVNLQQNGMAIRIDTRLRWNKSARMAEQANQQKQPPANQLLHPPLTLPNTQPETP